MEFSAFFDRTSLPALDKSIRSQRLSEQAIAAALKPNQVGMTSARRAALLGLGLLWHDHWDEAHRSVQAFEGDADCDLVHGILHRREGDVSNAQFWCRQVPHHASFDLIAAALRENQDRIPPHSQFLKDGTWSPLDFLNSVIKAQQVSKDKNKMEMFGKDLKIIQSVELITIAKSWWPHIS